MRRYFQSDNPDGWIVVSVSHNPIEELSVYAESYHSAGKRLVSIMKETLAYPDFDGYPIVFLYRHALELYLKAFVFQGAVMLRLLDINSFDTSNLFRHHNLKELFEDVKNIFRTLEWTWDTDDERFQNYDDFERIINQIHDLDPGSYNFRYPIDKKRKANLEHNTQINVIEFAKVMDIFLGMLEGGVLKLENDSDMIAEAKIELLSIINP
jgi:hypothetical protein